MLDITKLESGEYKVQARTFNVWDTLTDVVLSDEQRIENGRIDIQGLVPEREFVYATPTLCIRSCTTLWTTRSSSRRRTGSSNSRSSTATAWCMSRSKTPARALRPKRCPLCSSAFIRKTAPRGLNTRGSGLGLHICKVLVNLSGGQIKAESEPGKWCRFTFSLPAGQPEAAPARGEIGLPARGFTQVNSAKTKDPGAPCKGEAPGSLYCFAYIPAARRACASRPRNRGAQDGGQIDKVHRKAERPLPAVEPLLSSAGPQQAQAHQHAGGHIVDAELRADRRRAR